MKNILPVFSIFLLSVQVHAKVITKEVDYQAGDKKMRGVLALNDELSSTRPGVLVIPEWWGVNDYARERARQLAELGYVAFVADLYGEGKSTADPKKAGEWAGEAKQSGEIRSRARAALDTLAKQQETDSRRLASIGFCFGGMATLELAYSGAPLKGAVSFHGNLPALKEAEANQLRSAVLVLHGADDPFIKPEEQKAFEDSMKQAGANWQLVLLGGAKHSFTNPAASGLGMEGVGYDEKAATRSWQYMQYFFKEVFK